MKLIFHLTVLTKKDFFLSGWNSSKDGESRRISPSHDILVRTHVWFSDSKRKTGFLFATGSDNSKGWGCRNPSCSWEWPSLTTHRVIQSSQVSLTNSLNWINILVKVSEKKTVLAEWHPSSCCLSPQTWSQSVALIRHTRRNTRGCLSLRRFSSEQKVQTLV